MNEFEYMHVQGSITLTQNTIEYLRRVNELLLDLALYKNRWILNNFEEITFHLVGGFRIKMKFNLNLKTYMTPGVH